MKNKKISIRIFAIIATLILMFTLAMPCFADGEQNIVYDSFISQIPADMNTPAFDGLIDMFGSNLMEYDTVGSGYLSTEQNMTGFGGHDSNVTAFILGDFVIDVAGDILYAPNSYLTVSSSENNMVIGIFSDLSLEDSLIALFNYGIIINDEGLHYASLSDFIVGSFRGSFEDASSVSVAYGLYNDYTGLHNNIPSVLFGSYDVLHPSTYKDAYVQGSLFDEPVRSGMFGQLYNILKDAIFDTDVALDNTQDFVLTQIATWLTYIVLLLPLLVIGIILWKVFMR